MLKSFIKKHKIKDTTLCIGVSGGSDSLALALMANEQLSPLGYKIIAITVNHGLRPSAQEEADYVAKIMQQHNIEHHILHWLGQKPKTGIEEAARNARYELIGNWCKENNVKFLLTAHHLHDQAETFFMRLERGSGLDGLCGMKETFKRKNFTILRPLLNTNPQVMKDYLNAKNIKWIEDESNFCAELLRVKIRQFLPTFEKETGISALKIAQTMNRLQSTQKYLDNKISEILNTVFKNYNQKAYWCEAKSFIKFEQEIKFRILKKILKDVGQKDYAPQADKIFNLIEKINLTDFKAATLGNCHISVFADNFWILPEKPNNPAYSAKKWEEYVKKHPTYKTKKIPLRLKKLILK